MIRHHRVAQRNVARDSLVEPQLAENAECGREPAFEVVALRMLVVEFRRAVSRRPPSEISFLAASLLMQTPPSPPEKNSPGKRGLLAAHDVLGHAGLVRRATVVDRDRVRRVALGVGRRDGFGLLGVRGHGLRGRGVGRSEV